MKIKEIWSSVVGGGSDRSGKSSKRTNKRSICNGSMENFSFRAPSFPDVPHLQADHTLVSERKQSFDNMASILGCVNGQEESLSLGASKLNNEASADVREEKTQNLDHDKGIWSLLKSRLKPKKKEKHNFASFIELENGFSSTSRVKGYYRQTNQMRNSQDLTNCKYNVNTDVHRQDKATVIRSQNEPVSYQFKASTIDNQRPNSRNFAVQALLRSKKEEKILKADKNSQHRHLYVTKGTADRIDRWLTDNEVYMKSDDQESMLVTAVVRPHGTSNCKQVSNQPHELRHCQNFDKTHTNIISHPPESHVYQQLRQSCRSINVCPTARNVADLSSNPQPRSNRPSSYYQCHKPLRDQNPTADNKLSNSGSKTENKNRDRDNFSTKPPTLHESSREDPRDHQSNQKLLEVSEKLSLPTSPEMSCHNFTSGTEQLRENGRDNKDSQHEENALVDTNRFDVINEATLDRETANPSQKQAASQHESKSNLIDTSPSDKHLLQNFPSKSHADRSPADSPVSAMSSEPLDDVSLAESYCTEYTPHAFGNPVSRSILQRAHNDRHQVETFSSPTRGSDVYRSQLLPKSDMCPKSLFLAQNNATFKKQFSFNDRASLRKNYEERTKFVTTIYLTGDEINPESLLKNSYSDYGMTKVADEKPQNTLLVERKERSDGDFQNISNTQSAYKNFEENSRTYFDFDTILPNPEVPIEYQDAIRDCNSHSRNAEKDKELKLAYQEKVLPYFEISDTQQPQSERFDTRYNKERSLFTRVQIQVMNQVASDTTHCNSGADNHLSDKPQPDKRSAEVSKELQEVAKTNTTTKETNFKSDLNNIQMTKERHWVIKSGNKSRACELGSVEGVFGRRLSCNISRKYPLAISRTGFHKAYANPISPASYTNQNDMHANSYDESKLDSDSAVSSEELDEDMFEKPDSHSSYESSFLHPYNTENRQSSGVSKTSHELVDANKSENVKFRDERRSPPLNSFTSRSSPSIFGDISSETRSNSQNQSITQTSARDRLPSDQNPLNMEMDQCRTQSQYSQSGCVHGHTAEATDVPDASKSLLDVRKFMSIKHNDHARMFDFCFGNMDEASSGPYVGFDRLLKERANRVNFGYRKDVPVRNSSQRLTNEIFRATLNPRSAFYV